MKRLAKAIKSVHSKFDDSLINPPKQRNDKKDFKGQNIYQRKLQDGGPNPTPQQILQRTRIMQQQEIRIQPRNIRFKHFIHGILFITWYVGITLFIMYRMKGDDLEQLEKQVNRRQLRKKSNYQNL